MSGAALERRVERAAEAALAKQRYVSAIDVLVGLGWLAPTHRRGESLGRLMLTWAQDWAARSDFDLLRWDVWRTNEQLQDYYRSIGGEYIRTVHLAHRWSGALFQIPARRIANLSDDVVTCSPAATEPRSVMNLRRDTCSKTHAERLIRKPPSRSAAS